VGDSIDRSMGGEFSLIPNIYR